MAPVFLIRYGMLTFYKISFNALILLLRNCENVNIKRGGGGGGGVCDLLLTGAGKRENNVGLHQSLLCQSIPYVNQSIPCPSSDPFAYPDSRRYLRG